jgi:hypothetical protein
MRLAALRGFFRAARSGDFEESSDFMLTCLPVKKSSDFAASC